MQHWLQHSLQGTHWLSVCQSLSPSVRSASACCCHLTVLLPSQLPSTTPQQTPQLDTTAIRSCLGTDWPDYDNYRHQLQLPEPTVYPNRPRAISVSFDCNSVKNPSRPCHLVNGVEVFLHHFLQSTSSYSSLLLGCLICLVSCDSHFTTMLSLAAGKLQ